MEYFLIESTNLGFLNLLKVKTEMRCHKFLCNKVGHFPFKNTARLATRVFSKSSEDDTQLASSRDQRPEATELIMQEDIAFLNRNFYERLNSEPFGVIFQFLWEYTSFTNLVYAYN